MRYESGLVMMAVCLGVFNCVGVGCLEKRGEKNGNAGL